MLVVLLVRPDVWRPLLCEVPRESKAPPPLQCLPQSFYDFRFVFAARPTVPGIQGGLGIYEGEETLELIIPPCRVATSGQTFPASILRNKKRETWLSSARSDSSSAGAARSTRPAQSVKTFALSATTLSTVVRNLWFVWTKSPRSQSESCLPPNTTRVSSSE